MKKKITLLALISTSFALGQVGINTSSPKSTFDTNAKRDASGTITDNAQFYGLQAPRITRAELTNNTVTYGSDQQGALIYITDISGGNATAGTPREFINSLGYYYYDSSVNKWQKLVNSNNQIDYTATNGLTKSGVTIKLGGTLTEATSIEQGNNPLTISGNSVINFETTSSSGFPVSIRHSLRDTPSLWIGGTSGTPALNQAAIIGLNPNSSQGSYPISLGAQYIDGFSGQGNADFFIATSAGGVADKKLVVKNGGNVGIGTTSPSEKLDVRGNIAVRPSATGVVSSVNFYEDTANGSNKFTVQPPANLAADRSLILPSNAPQNGYALTTNSSGVTQWAAINPATATLASISLKNSPSAILINNGGNAGATINQRFFQAFDTVETDANSRFNLSTGTYTVSQSGIYLISAYIMPNSSPSTNENGFFYPVNLEVRKNCNGTVTAGTNIMDAATIRYATPGNGGVLRYSVLVTGMVSLSAGDTLNLVIYLTGTNAGANASGGMSFPNSFTYATATDYKALFSVTAL